MMILLDNAVKHSPPGGRVTLAAQPAERDGAAWVAIRVSDQGPGIPETEQARIFERFYRAPGARSGEGTGLGLAIGRWIVEEHQGRIELQSEPCMGAAFTVWLPAVAPPEGPTACGPAEIAPAAAGPAPREREPVPAELVSTRSDGGPA
jgi:two-component system sensor histidine kinase SenX3